MARELDLLTSSRLNATPFLQTPGENTYFFGVWGKIEFPPSTDDITYRVKQNDILNWPGLANSFYGDFRKAWIIWSVNSITDPWRVTVGTPLRIPSNETVDSVLANITKDSE